jgi:hypothetical protein
MTAFHHPSSSVLQMASAATSVASRQKTFMYPASEDLSALDHSYLPDSNSSETELLVREENDSSVKNLLVAFCLLKNKEIDGHHSVLRKFMKTLSIALK